MRFITIALSMLALFACGREARPAATAGCAYSATQEITWSNPTRPDVVTATSAGPNCAQAIVTFVVRNANGDALVARTAPYIGITTGAASLPQGASVSNEEVQRFLAGWADATLMHASEAPAWIEGATAPSAEDALQYDTPLDRTSYEALRMRDALMLCYAVASETSSCLTYDPVRGETDEVLRFGV